MELITRAEAAKMLTVSEETVDRLVKSGQLPAYKITRCIIRFDRADIEEYIADRYVKAEALKSKPRKRRTEPYCGGINNSGYYPGMQVVKP